jgi:hypothetical protein
MLHNRQQKHTADRFAQAKKDITMKKELLGFRFLLLIFISICFNSYIHTQTLTNPDTFIRVRKIKTFLISNPCPTYTVEIRNDQRISFYNNLPLEVFQNHSARIDKWGIDSTTVQVDSADFKLLEKAINGTDWENIGKIEKPISENGVKVEIVGGVIDKYIIELSNKVVKFSIDPNNGKYTSESAMRIRNIIEKLEQKYKPEK